MLDVTRPIVAVTDLVGKDFMLTVSAPQSLIRCGRRLPLVITTNLYYLSVHVGRATGLKRPSDDECYVEAIKTHRLGDAL
eukprot:325348-Heterocapsa_arctica.AAC.1